MSSRIRRAIKAFYEPSVLVAPAFVFAYWLFVIATILLCVLIIASRLTSSPGAS